VAADSASLGTTVLTAILSSSLVTAIAQAYFNTKLENQKTGLQEKLSAVEAEQTRLTNRLQATFSTLQTERAHAIKELYARIVRVEAILNEITLAGALRANDVTRYHTAVSDFVGYYLPNRIWLPSEISNQVGELRSTFSSLGKVLTKEVADGPSPSLDAGFKKGLVVVKGATAHALEDVSSSFRALLGAETA
jgi:hypothetical protein